ncbi:hypothetical protein E4U56_000019 [Claviceps arundinis]|uniref:Uncharacterized protein n=1 Tax=Claviceps arundinis TaxID=1623583 RepID=A0A9P7N333_9HYPO|nr:hypothetical protein E4U56_000019 [Claviceps arundinis]
MDMNFNKVHSKEENEIGFGARIGRENQCDAKPQKKRDQRQQHQQHQSHAFKLPKD